MGDDKDPQSTRGNRITDGRRFYTRCYCRGMIGRTPALLGGVLVTLVLAVPAGATTGIEVTIPVTVSLTDTGVKFSAKLDATTDTTLQVRVVNRSSARRWFQLGWRKTHLLRRGAVEYFYYSFHVPGRVVWRSDGPSVRAFKGSLGVRLPIGFG